MLHLSPVLIASAETRSWADCRIQSALTAYWPHAQVHRDLARGDNDFDVQSAPQLAQRAAAALRTSKSDAERRAAAAILAMLDQAGDHHGSTIT